VRVLASDVFLDLPEAEWDRVVTVNLKGVFTTCRAVLPGMVERRSGQARSSGRTALVAQSHKVSRPLRNRLRSSRFAPRPELVALSH